MVAWSVELSEFNLQYEPHGPMKTQFMADFLGKFARKYQTTPDYWSLYVDGASNNQIMYETLITGLKVAKEVGAKKLRCYIDS